MGREVGWKAVEVRLEEEAAAAWAAAMQAEARAARLEARAARLEGRVEGGVEGGCEVGGEDEGGGGGEAVKRRGQGNLASRQHPSRGAIPHVTTPHATPAACRAKGGALEGSRRSPAVSPPLPPPPPPLSSAPTELPSTSTGIPSTTRQATLTSAAFPHLDATPPSSDAPPSASRSQPPSAPPRAATAPTASIHPIDLPAASPAAPPAPPPEARLAAVATPRASLDTSGPPAACKGKCQGREGLGERATALLARQAAASRVAAAAISLAALAASTPLSARASPHEVDTSAAAPAAAAAEASVSVTGQPLRPPCLPEDLLVAAVTAPTAALLAARAAAAAPRSVAEATHTAAVFRLAKLLEAARGGKGGVQGGDTGGTGEAAGARGGEARLGRRDGRASGRPDPLERGGHSTATATATLMAMAMATATAGRRGRDGRSHAKDSTPEAVTEAVWSKQRAGQRALQQVRVVRSGHTFFPYNHGPGRLRGEAAPFTPPRLKPGSATSVTSAGAKQPNELQHPNSATQPDEAGEAAQRVVELLPLPQPRCSPATQPCLTRLAHPLGDYARTGTKGKCRPGSSLPYRWPGRPMTPPVE